jgi:hypothetical protein
MDFTFAAYKKLIESAANAGYQAITVREYLQGIRKPLTLILRHDVEWNPRRALAFAELEKACGFRSTFYFRVDTKAFDLSIMRQLQDEGFEVGYHFNTLDRCGGDFNKAIALFERELKMLREAEIKVETVCSHGDPRVKKVGYKVNNEIFLKDPDLRSRNGLLGEAYLDLDFSSLTYLSDVGIRWNKASFTQELIFKIVSHEWPVIYMLTHPDYWSCSPLRAFGLRLAAKGIRYFRVNQIIASVRHVVALLKR